jgi:hypothetical protein
MSQFVGALVFDPSRAAPPAGAVWVPEVFERSGGAGWIWYVVATLRPGRTQGRFPIPVFRELLAQGLATRGDVPGGFSDAVLDKMEAERLTPEERAAKDAQRARNAAAVRRANCQAGEDCRTIGRTLEDMAENAPETASELGHNVKTVFGYAANVVGRVAGTVAGVAGETAGAAAAGVFGGLSTAGALVLGAAVVAVAVYLVRNVTR